MTNTIPVTILTGFLGAGKTTLLNRIINSNPGMKVAVLVNDFGSINIDSQLVVDVQGDMISLSNGCICCTIRGDFAAAVEQVVAREDKPDTIVVEASGVADPIDIGLTFKYMDGVTIDSILTVIDAEQILSLEQQYAVLAMNQVGMADMVIINKVDLVSEDDLEAVRRYVRKIAKDARTYETQHADVPLALILNVGGYDMNRLLARESEGVHVHEVGQVHDHEHHHVAAFSTWSWAGMEPVSLWALKRALERLPTSVYRAKGVFHTLDDPDHRLLVQVVGRRITLETGASWDDTRPSSQFVLIAAHDSVDAEAMQALLDGTLVSNAPRGGLERLARGVASWLRGG